MNEKPIAKVLFTEYDAYFTIIYTDGEVHQIPYIHRPDLKEAATCLKKFRYEITGTIIYYLNSLEIIHKEA